MANRYWIGNSGNWTDTSHWSATSGGAGGASVPTSADDAIFNASSFTANGQTVTVNAFSNIFNLDMRSVAYALNLAGASSLVMDGDVTLCNKVTVTAPLSVQNSWCWFTQNGATINATVTVGTSGWLDMRDAFSASALNLGIVSAVTNGKLATKLTTNNYPLTVGSMAFYYADDINFGTSTVTVTGSGFNIINASTTTFHASGATFLFTGNGTFDLNYSNVGILRVSGNTTIKNSHIYSTIELLPGSTLVLTSGGMAPTQQTLTNFIANGTSLLPITIKASTIGKAYVLSKTAGIVSADYINVQDSNVTGGATWNAYTSTNNGNNTGWNFLGPTLPIADFTSTPNNGFRPLLTAFTDKSSGTPTSWLWSFGDGASSTTQNPTHSYTQEGAFDVSLTVTNTVGTNSRTSIAHITTTTQIYTKTFSGSSNGTGTLMLNSQSETGVFSSSASGTGTLTISTTYQALAQKEYEYRVFDENWNYISTWQDVTSEFQYSHRINENASELSVTIGRAPDNRVVRLDALKDTAGANILDENSETILVATETENSVGDGTDIRENLNIEVYAFYGGYEALQDTGGNDILDENSSVILTQYGAPNGKRVYSGYIADYDLTYGETTGVDVVIVPQATSTSHYVFKAPSGNTTVPYSSTDPVLMARNAMANYTAQGGLITYSTASMPLSGQSANYSFKLQTTRASIDKTIDLLPTGYYHFVDPGENVQYLLQKGSASNHTFYYEQHISTLKLRKSITQLINKVYFVGGEVSAGVDLFRYYQDSASIASIRPGLEILTDSRVTLASSADTLSNRRIAEFKMARWRTSVVITDVVYDIETIKLGQMVGFKNFGTFADNLVLQIVGLGRKKHSITLDLDMIIPGEAKRLEDLKRALLSEQISNVGVTPA